MEGGGSGGVGVGGGGVNEMGEQKSIIIKGIILGSG